MKVNLVDIPEQGLTLNIAADGSVLQRELGKVDFSILSPVSANITLSKSDRGVYVNGNMTSALKLRCAKCLKEFEYKLNSKIDIVYSLEPEYRFKEKELTKDEIGINYLSGDEIDVEKILLEQLSLDMPIKPVCTVKCKGLCLKCGADLNIGRCNCPSEEHIDKRFTKLKEIRLKKK